LSSASSKPSLLSVVADASSDEPDVEVVTGVGAVVGSVLVDPVVVSRPTSPDEPTCAPSSPVVAGPHPTVPSKPTMTHGSSPATGSARLSPQNGQDLWTAYR